MRTNSNNTITITTTTTNNNNNNSNNHHNNKTKGYIVTPYVQGLCVSIKAYVVHMASTPTSRATEPSGTYLYPIKTGIQYNTKWCYILVQM